jgi:threonine synthase
MVTEAVVKNFEKISEENSLAKAYGSHAYLPFNIPGYATASYELVEQLGDVPGTIIMPAGQGGLLLGVGRGFRAMQAAGYISRMPNDCVRLRHVPPLLAVFNYVARVLPGF